jgi:hypothetical protein
MATVRAAQRATVADLYQTPGKAELGVGRTTLYLHFPPQRISELRAGAIE